MRVARRIMRSEDDVSHAPSQKFKSPFIVEILILTFSLPLFKLIEHICRFLIMAATLSHFRTFHVEDGT